MKTIIIGAGFTGMASGIKTGSPIYEATDHAGGICTDYVKDGFRFSNGGPHYLFGKDAGLEYIKSLVEVKEYERKAGVYYNHIFPYPFQSNFKHAMMFHPVREDNFKNWLTDTFMSDKCDMFFYPFNEKYTAGLYDQIIPQDAYKSPKTGTGWVSTFCDPVNGLSDLVSKMASQCKINFNKKAVSIDAHNKLVKFDDLWIQKYDRLISTIPLGKCLQLCGNTDFNLPYTSVLVINIGAERGHSTPEEHWLYIPFCKSGFHRVSFYTNVDQTKAPAGKVGLSVEMAFKDVEYKNLKVEEISFGICKELQEWGWIGDPIVVHPNWVDCAYTWQYNKDDAQKGIDWLKERDIYSVGRYGKWKFCGITQSIMMGRKMS